MLGMTRLLVVAGAVVMVVVVLVDVMPQMVTRSTNQPAKGEDIGRWTNAMSITIQPYKQYTSLPNASWVATIAKKPNTNTKTSTGTYPLQQKKCHFVSSGMESLSNIRLYTFARQGTKYWYCFLLLSFSVRGGRRCCSHTILQKYASLKNGPNINIQVLVSQQS